MHAGSRTLPGSLRLASCGGVWLLLFSCAGCSLMLSAPPPADSQSLLRAVEATSGSATMEIFQVRIPSDEQELTDEIWKTVDEQRFDLETRRHLVSNGLRAGVFGGPLPDALARRLNLQSEMPEASTRRLITGGNAAPQVTRRVIQLNRYEPAIIQASELRDELTVLINSEEGLRGRSYQQAQAIYTMQAEPATGQRIELRLTPELQHGELRNRITGSDQGLFLYSASRDREIYDRLKLTTELSAGEMLILSCTPDASGTLGHAFHAVERGGPAEQKLILVRLLQVPGSEILADSSP